MLSEESDSKLPTQQVRVHKRLTLFYQQKSFHAWFCRMRDLNYLMYLFTIEYLLAAI